MSVIVDHASYALHLLLIDQAARDLELYSPTAYHTIMMSACQEIPPKPLQVVREETEVVGKRGWWPSDRLACSMCCGWGERRAEHRRQPKKRGLQAGGIAGIARSYLAGMRWRAHSGGGPAELQQSSRHGRAQAASGRRQDEKDPEKLTANAEQKWGWWAQMLVWPYGVAPQEQRQRRVSGRVLLVITGMACRNDTSWGIDSPPDASIFYALSSYLLAMSHLSTFKCMQHFLCFLAWMDIFLLCAQEWSQRWELVSEGWGLRTIEDGPGLRSI